MDWRERAERRARKDLYTSDYRYLRKIYKDGYLSGVKDALEEARARLIRESDALRPHSDDMADATISGANWVRALGEGL